MLYNIEKEEILYNVGKEEILYNKVGKGEILYKVGKGEILYKGGKGEILYKVGKGEILYKGGKGEILYKVGKDEILYKARSEQTKGDNSIIFRISGMSHTIEFFAFDNTDANLKPVTNGSIPMMKDGDNNTEIYFCHYKPMDCGMCYYYDYIFLDL
jgi:hypothetical protein